MMNHPLEDLLHSALRLWWLLPLIVAWALAALAGLVSLPWRRWPGLLVVGAAVLFALRLLISVGYFPLYMHLISMYGFQPSIFAFEALANLLIGLLDVLGFALLLAAAWVGPGRRSENPPAPTPPQPADERLGADPAAG